MDSCVISALAGVVLGCAIGAGVPARMLLRILAKTGNGNAGRVADAMRDLSTQLERDREPDGNDAE